MAILEYQVMLLALFNAPACFQGYITKIMAKKLNIFVILYLDMIHIKNSGQDHVDVI